MAKKRRHCRVRDETMQRDVLIYAFFPRVSMRVNDPKTADPEIERRPWLELRGQMLEPIQNVRDVAFHASLST